MPSDIYSAERIDVSPQEREDLKGIKIGKNPPNKKPNKNAAISLPIQQNSSPNQAIHVMAVMNPDQTLKTASRFFEGRMEVVY